MALLRRAADSPLTLRLNRDLARSLKRGHPWVYADALRSLPPAPPGTSAILLDNRKGREVARGCYDPDSPLAFRACSVEDGQPLNEKWAERRFVNALALRRMLFMSGPGNAGWPGLERLREAPELRSSTRRADAAPLAGASLQSRSGHHEPTAPSEPTTGYRLFNGEGDGLPGLVADIYGDTAVLKFDGDGPRGFWNPEGIAAWLVEQLRVNCVYERSRERGSEGEVLHGREPNEPVPFLENGMRFTADVVRGQKTGFFLDQRDNRHLIRNLAAGKRTLNLFGYTGGFSVAAGLGGASHVTTVDLAAPALEAAEHHWRLNGLPEDAHNGIVSDAFEFLETAAQQRDRWELVVIDPPSFASSKAAVEKARAAYQRLITDGAAVTSQHGLLAVASCSSHIDLPMFLALCEEGLSQARRRGTVLHIGGQPADHPTPLVLPEFRYLKFILLRVE